MFGAIEMKTPETLYEWIFNKSSIELSFDQYINNDGDKCLYIELIVYETEYGEITGIQVVREQDLIGSEIPDNEKDLVKYLDWMYEDARKVRDAKARYK